MKNTRDEYACTACGATYARWMGKCSKCGEFNTVVEARPARTSTAGMKSGMTATTPHRSARRINDIESVSHRRIPSGVSEFDRILNGGMVPGQVTLLAGPPGCGKSTLLLEVMNQYALQGKTCLYVSGEESAEQIGLRAQRMGVKADNLLVADETDLNTILGHIEESSPDFIVIDSVQTVASPELDGRAGGVAQVQEVASTITRLAKSGRQCCVIMVGQITKSLEISGPKTLEHLVDTVLFFEGDRASSLRILRVDKNRFGAADEISCWEQEEDGIKQVTDPSGLFATERNEATPGVCITVMLEGRKALVSEIQALVSPNPSAPNPRRGVSGLDSARVAMLLAVTEKHGRIRLYDKDTFVATVGGMKITEPSADLAICLAVSSAANDSLIPLDVCAIGEVALSGDVRRVPQIKQRLAEAVRLGFKRAFVPPGAPSVPGITNISISHVKNAFQAIQQLSDQNARVN